MIRAIELVFDSFCSGATPEAKRFNARLPELLERLENDGTSFLDSNATGGP